MFSSRRCAQLGIVSAALVLVLSLTILLQGRESLRPRQESTGASSGQSAPNQIVYNEQAPTFSH
jgi:hypothetical protein